MKPNAPKCVQIVDTKKCVHCNGHCVKNGKVQQKQRYRCQACKKTFIDHYYYKACQPGQDEAIIAHIKEGCGIRSIARLLKIGVSTVLRRIIQIARAIRKPPVCYGKEYELDELCTYVGKKKNRVWIAYAIRKDTKEVMDFKVGNRTVQTLKKVTDTLLLSSAVKVYTDKLRQYTSLLPSSIHVTRQYGINKIERMNLSMRTDMKRLNRRTICYSKSQGILEACLKIYFWSRESA